MKASRFGVVRSRFNEDVTGALLKSCVKTLRAAGVAEKGILIVEVPGGFELPWAVNELARSGQFDAVIALGCVLKGGTPQNDYISQATFTHLQQISIDTRTPVALGVITPKTYDQAVARTKGAMDRGKEAAEAALEMARLKVHGGR